MALWLTGHWPALSPLFPLIFLSDHGWLIDLRGHPHS
jgi:hypothetical protein